MSETHSVQQRIAELEETLAIPSLPPSVRQMMERELTTLRAQQQDPKSLFNAGLSKQVLAGTAGIISVGSLVASGLAPLFMTIPETGIVTWATSMGLNALSGWLAEWAVKHGDALLRDGATEDQIATEIQTQIEQSSDPALTDDVADLLNQTQAIATALDAISQETEFQSDTLLDQLRLIEQLLAGYDTLAANQRRSDLIQGRLHKHLIATLHEQQTTLVEAYKRGEHRLSDQHQAILDNIARLEQKLGVHISGGTVHVAVGTNLGTIIYGRDPKEEEQQRLVRYLDALAQSLHRLPLQAIATRLDKDGEGIALPAVYTLLATTRRVEVARGTQEKLSTYFDEDNNEQLQQTYDPAYALPTDALFVQSDREVDDSARDDRSSSQSLLRLERAMLVSEAVQQSPHMVLRGDPGSGKSTVVRYMAWVLARHGLRHGEQDSFLQGWDANRPKLPIVQPLRLLAGQLAKPAQAGQQAAATVTATLQATMAGCDALHVDDILRESLYRGAAVIFFDGLDEVPPYAEPRVSVDRITTVQAIKAFSERYQKCMVVVTCRTRAFSDDLRACLGWPVEELAPFTLGQVRHFVPAWYNELVYKKYLSPEQAQRYGDELLTAIQDTTRPRLREMAAIPLLLTMMAWIVCDQGRLPRDRPALYEAILTMLLEQWDEMKEGATLADVIGEAGWNGARLRPLLDRLSYDAHCAVISTDGRGRLAASMLKQELERMFTTAGMREDRAAAAAVRCLHHIDQRSGLLRPDGDDYVFAHLTLQEHCAGRHLTRQRDAVKLVMQHRGEDRWREPIFLGLGVIQSNNPWLIEAVLKRLLEQREDGKPKPPARWLQDLFLANELGNDRDWSHLRDLGVCVEELQSDLRQGLVALLADPAQSLPVAERVRAGFLLGDLGDPRVPVTLEQWKRTCAIALTPNPSPDGRGASEPPSPTGRRGQGDEGIRGIPHPSSLIPDPLSHYWRYVPAGTYIIGSGDDDPDARDEEKPQHTVTIKQPFYIARYPITNAQWQAWVQEAGGKPSRSANNRDFNRSNQPVVNIAWEWCNAFCRWLSEQLGCEVRLPTEAEWEAAARGGDARRYPWGDAWRDDHAATTEDKKTRGWQSSVPVGCYAAGAAPCGTLDMAGNVWEWTADVWRSHPGAAKPFEEKHWYVVKGGLYYVNRTYVRCAARFRLPHGYHHDVGLRLLLLPPRFT